METVSSTEADVLDYAEEDRDGEDGRDDCRDDVWVVG